ncbi:hypothetical protein [Cellulomonas sp. IC4_254]|uniref:WXG100 family type VII secretion target n=1 Tax=Cellulomonas sp. IC4_254 TaxID=2714040 RepID=UPI001423C3DB|nr:hypothetical protein [Cellulomonas sp. IC4_254]NHT19182.1 hypothetical protein [Cellulomonas sp. IC4_254]
MRKASGEGMDDLLRQIFTKGEGTFGWATSVGLHTWTWRAEGSSPQGREASVAAMRHLAERLHRDRPVRPDRPLRVVRDLPHVPPEHPVTGVERRPDKGVPAECDRAAEQVRGICADLAGAASTASNLASTVRTAWQGQAGNAFCSSLDAATQSSRLTVAAWDRVKDELVRYATRLRDIQTRGDQIRSALSSAEDSLSTAKKTLARYQKDDDTAAWRITHARGTVDSLTHDIATQVVALDNLRAERQALDNATATALHTAPGAGAAAWQAIAYRNGRTVPRTDILDELLDLLDRDPIGNLDLLHQFLLMHSNDAELMGTFFDGVGARGLIDLMRRAGPGGTATFIFGLLATGFVTASSGWSSDKQRAFGAALVDALKPDTVSSLTSDQELLARLLASPGVPPRVGLGAFGRLDELRHVDPAKFATITSPLGGPPGTADFTIESLTNTLFLLMSQVPGEARDYFFSRSDPTEAVAYWYGRHPWASDGFTGPAALLRAIANEPVDLAGDNESWKAILGFCSTALDNLGGRPDYNTANVSPAAALDIAIAISAFIPEIAGNIFGDQDRSTSTGVAAEIFRDGLHQNGPTLDAKFGNLARALGVATTHPSALNAFLVQVRAYGDAVLAHVTGATPPTLDQTRTLLSTVSAVWGFTHAAYSVEAAGDAARLSNSSRALLDQIFAVGGLVPIPGASKGLDIGVDAVTTVAPGLLATIIPQILTDDQLLEIRNNPKTAGRDELNTRISDALETALAGMNPPYTVVDLDIGRSRLATIDDFAKNIGGAYDAAAAAFSSEETDGAYSVSLSHSDETASRDQMAAGMVN